MKIYFKKYSLFHGFMSNLVALQYILLLISVFTLNGCSLMEIQKQTATVGNFGTLHGVIQVKSKLEGPIVVVRYRNNNGFLIRENQIIASSQGEYQFGVSPGQYTVFAFIDVNKDGEFQQDKEHGNYHKGPLFFKVEAKQTTEVKTLKIDDDIAIPVENIKVVINKDEIIKNIGKVTTLQNPKFTQMNYSMGMWRPLDYLVQVGGGLMMLQKYEKGKIPVVFVHGINGGPTNFQTIINSLDRTRYQPWVLFYPSGLRLDMVSDYFVQAVKELDSRYGFNEFSIVAHSMGGLVTRSFVKKYTKRFPSHAKNIKFVITVNSPMAGMPSAASGVKNSPIIVPSWRDIAENSEFLKDLHSWDWPSEIPYYVVFSYADGGADDGVVALNSQIPFKLQKEVIRMYGFNNSHAGTLDDKKFIILTNSILAKYTN